MNNNEKRNSLELIATVSDFFKDVHPEIRKYEFPEVGTFRIGLISIVKYSDGYYLNMDEHADSAYLKMWKNDVGGILLRDIKRSALGNYFEFDKGNKVGLLRRVNAEDDAAFAEYGLPYIAQGDFKYVFIRFRNAGDTYMTKDRIEHYEPDAVEEPSSCYTELEEDINNEPKSFELF